MAQFSHQGFRLDCGSAQSWPQHNASSGTGPTESEKKVKNGAIYPANYLGNGAVVEFVVQTVGRGQSCPKLPELRN